MVDKKAIDAAVAEEMKKYDAEKTAQKTAQENAAGQMLVDCIEKEQKRWWNWILSPSTMVELLLYTSLLKKCLPRKTVQKNTDLPKS